MILTAPVRWILPSLIAIGLQLCCCNFHVLFSGCCDGQSKWREGDVARVAGGSRQGDAHHLHHDDAACGACGHKQGQSPKHDDGKSGKPCSPCKHKDDGGCICGTHDKAPSQVVKFELPMTVVALRRTPISFLPHFTISAPRYAELHGVFPPRTTLLQQHCALIV
jgi:hypothetical protein